MLVKTELGLGFIEFCVEVSYMDGQGTKPEHDCVDTFILALEGTMMAKRCRLQSPL